MQPERGVIWSYFRSDAIGTEMALDSSFDAFSLREPVSTPLENALVLEDQPCADRAVETPDLRQQLA